MDATISILEKAIERAKISIKEKTECQKNLKELKEDYF
jgi:hypothetical protein